MAVKVSIVILTYNHEDYIAEALDSVLAQETDFDFEIVVGDDASADRTPQILTEYAERHPDVFNLILRKRNLGANRNFVEVTRHCQGDYVAMIDGDDYWTRTDKLQTQVNFLDSHPDFAICGHQVEFVYQDEESYRRHFPSLGTSTPPQKEDGNLADALEIPAYLPTRSRVYRRALLEHFPGWFGEVTLGDWVQLVLLAQRGRIASINQVMAVQRIHVDGMWSGMPELKRWVEMVRVLDYLEGYLASEHRPLIRRQKAQYYKYLSDALASEGRRLEAGGYLARSAALQIGDMRLPRGVGRRALLLWRPRVA